MKLFANDEIKPGSVRIEQDDGRFECALDALIFEAGDHENTTMTANLADVAVAMVRWFAPAAGGMQ